MRNEPPAMADGSLLEIKWPRVHRSRSRLKAGWGTVTTDLLRSATVRVRRFRRWTRYEQEVENENGVRDVEEQVVVGVTRIHTSGRTTGKEDVERRDAVGDVYDAVRVAVATDKGGADRRLAAVTHKDVA